jgi:protein-tyrosine phosphatase
VTTHTLASFANLRDLGGHVGAHGKSLKRGRVYRSANLASDSPDIIAQLASLGVRSIVDLRANKERETHPTPWSEMGCKDYWFHDHTSNVANLAISMRDCLSQPSVVRERMVALYRELPFTQREGYRTLFSRLADHRTPLLFHCSAGKDRTGVGAALLLSSLGVPGESILRDYQETNNFDLNSKFKGHEIQTLAPAESLAAMSGAHPEYLEAALAEIVERCGSIAGYLHTVLSLGAAEIDRVRAHLLE